MYNDDPYVHESEHLRLTEGGRKVTALPEAALTPGATVILGNISYYSDGTRWLSSTLYPLVMPYAANITFPASVTASTVLRAGAPDDTQGIYITKAVIRANTNTTLDITNNWSIQLFRQDSAGISTQTGATLNTFVTGRVAGGSYLNTITVNTAYTLANIYLLFVSVTKNGGAGTLGFDPAVIWFRLCGN